MLEKWPLMQCTEEEKIQWFKDSVGSTIGKITLTGDRVEEIVVVDELYDTAAAALEDIPLPSEFPDQPNVSREQLERDFAAYCKQLVIRTATVEQLAIPDMTLSPEFVFIRPITSKMKIQGFLDQWDRSIGFSEGLRSMGCPLEFSLEDKKLIFGMTHMMNCLAMQSSRQTMTPSNVNMFTMDR